MVGKKWAADFCRMHDLAHMTKVSHALNGRLRLNPQTWRLAWLERFRANWHATFDALVPMGYEDDSGFHYGLESAEDHLSGTSVRKSAN